MKEGDTVIIKATGEKAVIDTVLTSGWFEGETQLRLKRDFDTVKNPNYDSFHFSPEEVTLCNNSNQH